MKTADCKMQPLFFDKKNQKFLHIGTWLLQHRGLISKRFLLLFFSKKKCLPCF